MFGASTHSLQPRLIGPKPLDLSHVPQPLKKIIPSPPKPSTTTRPFFTCLHQSMLTVSNTCYVTIPTHSLYSQCVRASVMVSGLGPIPYWMDIPPHMMHPILYLPLRGKPHSSVNRSTPRKPRAGSQLHSMRTSSQVCTACLSTRPKDPTFHRASYGHRPQCWTILPQLNDSTM
jgi:hypothetical protein